MIYKEKVRKAKLVSPRRIPKKVQELTMAMPNKYIF